VVADLTIQAGDVMVVDRQNVRLPLREVAIEGIRLDVLPDLLKGVKAGETRTAQITIGAEADNEEVRGREADLTVKVARIERLRLPDDAELLAATGYEDTEALRAAIRRQQESRSEAQFRDAQEEAVRRWLLEHCPFDLPEDLVRRHANRLLQRRLMSLQYRGVPAEEIEKHMEDLSGASSEQAARDLRLYFIIDAIAKKENLEVTDAEVNARIQFMAVQYGRRPDRLREEMGGPRHQRSPGPRRRGAGTGRGRKGRDPGRGGGCRSDRGDRPEDRGDRDRRRPLRRRRRGRSGGPGRGRRRPPRRHLSRDLRPDRWERHA